MTIPDDKPLTDDDNTLGTRLRRYGQVSATVAGLATKLAGQKFLGRDIAQDVHADQLRQVLGSMKGPIMKVGQILATIPEALPPAYAEAFQELQANAPPMGWPFVRRRMATELGPDWASAFTQFSQTANAAASLGQVHRATTKDGLDVACKLQYPDMAAAITADLQQLKVLFALYERLDKAVRTQNIYAELSARLMEEVDYGREARMTRLYGFMMQDRADIHVPEVVDDLSTGRLLTTTWLEGRKIMDYKSAPQDVRDQLAVTLFHAWYIPFYRYGIIHGDPHMGNYTVQPDNTLNLFDFGCIRVFPERLVRGVILLYRALQNDDRAAIVHAFETWGFTNLSVAHIDTLTLWAKFLYGPLLEDKVRTIGEAKGQVYGIETAQKVHQQLRDIGGLNIPREFVFMDRAALGLGSVFIHLQSQVNWYQLFNILIADFDGNTLADNQQKALAQFGLNKTAE
ncbi:MAG: AarF/ABC1/UbiB kinase family protein [Pseudomonadota bacterium]